MEKIEVYPLDFREFLTFKKIQVSETENYKYEKYTDDYLKTGGYPEYVLGNNPAYFSDLVNNILYKDIVSIYQLRNPDLLKDLFLLLSDRVGSQTTYSKLASVLSLKNDTVKEYIYYLKNIFLMDELPRFTYSRSHRIYGPKKFYILDNGLLYHLAGKLNYGSAFEQTLFNHFRVTKQQAGFYYSDRQEIDFVVESPKRKEFWEAKYAVNDINSEARKLIPIALKEKVSKIVYVTKSLSASRRTEGIDIRFIPLWKILLKN